MTADLATRVAEALRLGCYECDSPGVVADTWAEVRRLQTEVERLKALFQQTHGVHWTWVEKATQATQAEADARRLAGRVQELEALLKEGGK